MAMDKEMLDVLHNIKPAPLPVYEGTLLPSFIPLRDGGLERRMKEIVDFESCDNDILICSYPKSGNHWTLEIVEMLLNQKAELTDTTVTGLLLELTDLEPLHNVKTTRTLHTHLPYRFLSSSQLIKQCKIIVLVRNPKDVCVSWHNHCKKDIFINYDISWNQFYEKWMNDEMPYGSWYDHVTEFEEAQKTGNRNIMLLHYEDLKVKPCSTIKQLAEFLQTPYSENLINDIVKVTSFDNMRKNKKELSKLFDPEGKGLIFRKGEIGDWKHWFTVKQKRRFQ